ncbi:DUF6064 family protein [Guyparkeria halophila]|uniref:DUF6064 family protein n=1 Tax=Guyparkeria halophila TaxID=47960 RepID=A0ABZ0YWI9_9GAMM|nr:DUF6064 family protein [Guyparkeria halophila]WQH16545.1 DUF6064 family protein [Guyparkeria halophila]
MQTWLSYRLSDLLMFSPATYARLFERVNEAVWPGHLLLAALTVAMLVLAGSRGGLAHRLAAGLLATAWGWVAWRFFGLYAEINLAAPWFAALFVAQTVMLLILATIGPGLALGRPRRIRHWLGLGLALWGLVLHPLAWLATGRPPVGTELFAVAPDPTAIATIGLLLMARLSRRGILLALPLAWLSISALSWWALLTA